MYIIINIISLQLLVKQVLALALVVLRQLVIPSLKSCVAGITDLTFRHSSDPEPGRF